MSSNQSPDFRAENGVLDLRQTVLREGQLIPLRGEWTFRKWDGKAYADPVIAVVPNYWKNLEVDGKALGTKAIGRYELKLLLNVPRPNDTTPDQGPLPYLGPEQDFGKPPPRPGGPRLGPPSVLIPSTFGSAYRLRVNRTPPLASDGRIDFKRQTSIGGYSLASVPIPIKQRQGDTITLYLDFANHQHHLGGLAAAPLLGGQKTVERYEFWWTFPALFVGSLLFGFSLLCLGLFLIFRGRKLLLYAMLFCGFGVIRLLFSDAMPIRYLSTNLPWNLVLSLRYLTLPFSCYAIGLYLLALLPGEENGKLKRFFVAGVGLLSLLVVVLPPFFKSYVFYLTQVYILATVVIVTYLLWRERNNEQLEMTIVRFTAALAFAFVVGEFINFYGNYSLRGTQTYVLLVISAGIALIVLRDVMRLNTERTALTHELQTANQELSGFARSLEAKVELRTQELAERNEELEALQRFRQRTNAMIVHDLKNPLQVILSQASAGVSADRRIHTAGRRMLLMIQNLLDVDRAEQTKLKVRKEHFPLADLVRDAVDRQRGLTTEKSIRIEIDISLKTKIVSDRNLTERAIDNVLHNAVKYTPFGGGIRVFTEQSDRFVALFCDDSGPGVPEGLREQIFRDYASDRTQPDAYGLGLSFVRIAMEALGGKVAVGTSENGVGGRFVLYFPAVTNTLPSRPTLSAQHKNSLAPHLEKLRKTPCYQATTIEDLLEDIPDADGLLVWKQALREAMYNGDEFTYQELLK